MAALMRGSGCVCSKNSTNAVLSLVKKQDPTKTWIEEAGRPNMNTVATIRQSGLLARCVSIDLEVDPEKAQILPSQQCDSIPKHQA